MFKGTIIQYFHWYLSNDGNLWNHVKAEGSKLKSLGFSALWLPPACKSAKGMEGSGYEIYDLFDLGEFDQKGSVKTKYGSKSEYIEAVKAIHNIKNNSRKPPLKSPHQK